MSVLLRQADGFEGFGSLLIEPPLEDASIAWLWALRNSRFQATPSVVQGVDACMADYVMFRCGFESFEDARVSLAEPLRAAYDALYPELDLARRAAF